MGECWSHRDVRGEQESVFCGFAYGRKSHTLGVLIDYARGGLAKDAFFSGDFDAILAQLHDRARDDPGVVLAEILPGHARKLMEKSFALTDQATDVPVSEGPAGMRRVDPDFVDARALALRRMALLSC